jgi:hypothetical protein
VSLLRKGDTTGVIRSSESIDEGDTTGVIRSSESIDASIDSLLLITPLVYPFVNRLTASDY